VISTVEVWRSALYTITAVAAPFVLTALAVGLIASLLQAATQLQENAISFVPKLIAVGFILIVGGPWLLGQLERFTKDTAEVMVRVGQDGAK